MNNKLPNKALLRKICSLALTNSRRARRYVSHSCKGRKYVNVRA